MSISISGLENGLYWLYATDSAFNISEPEVITILGVGIEKSSLHLFNVYPNPFIQYATLNFALKKDQVMWLTLMDSQGRVVKKQSLGHLVAGQQQFILQRNGLPEGLYFFRLENSEGEGRSGRIIIRD